MDQVILGFSPKKLEEWCCSLPRWQKNAGRSDIG